MRNLGIATYAKAWTRELLGIRRARQRSCRGAVIVTYHGVVRKIRNSDLDAYCIDEVTFEQHLRHFKRHFQPVPLRVLVDTLLAGEEPESNWVSLTLDDALRNQATRAAQILTAHDMPWSIAVPTGVVDCGRSIWTYELAFLLLECWGDKTVRLPGDPEMTLPTRTRRERRRALAESKRRFIVELSVSEREACLAELISQCGEREFRERFEEYGEFAACTWEHIRGLAARGVDVLSHGYGHAQHSPNMTDQELRWEVYESRRRIHEVLGNWPAGFALPGGTRDCRSEAIVASAGYQFCLTSVPGRVGKGTSPFRLPRIDGEYPMTILRTHVLRPEIRHEGAERPPA